RFNQEIGRALIENDHGQLTEPALRRLFDAAANDGTNAAPNAPRNFIEDTYDGIFFTRAENRWLDNAVCHISRVGDAFERSMFWFCLFQAALAKRPYNLFHRANLYMRQADVPRSFGNKASWDRSFEDHMTKFARELNRAVFAGTSTCHAFCDDALNLSPSFDLVYIDTPYISGRRAAVDYRDFYHFLEGLVHYDQWSKMIDWSSKHRRMQNMDNPWCKADSCLPAFQSLFRHYADANIAVSYRSHGIPSIDELVAALGSVKPRVSVHELGVHQYALSTEKKNQEMLIVGTDN
ncbi:MAG: DNA methyltransferase, partial [Phycisphaerae bacterium]